MGVKPEVGSTVQNGVERQPVAGNQGRCRGLKGGMVRLWSVGKGTTCHCLQVFTEAGWRGLPQAGGDECCSHIRRAGEIRNAGT